MNPHLQHILMSMRETIDKLKIANEFHELREIDAMLMLEAHMKEISDEIQRKHLERSDTVVRTPISERALHARHKRAGHDGFKQ